MDGLLQRTPDGFVVTERGRPFVRTICSCFGAYLGKVPAQHVVRLLAARARCAAV